MRLDGTQGPTAPALLKRTALRPQKECHLSHYAERWESATVFQKLKDQHRDYLEHRCGYSRNPLSSGDGPKKDAAARQEPISRRQRKLNGPQ